MAGAEALLEPISDAQPTGEDLSSSAEYAEIEGAYRDADVPADMVFAETEGSDDTNFAGVVDLAEEFLRTRSKDLKIATFLASARLRAEGFEGLASGLELLCDYCDRYWDELHPGTDGRAAILGWLGGDDPRGTEPMLRVCYVVQLSPLTDDGHSFFHYREWRKLEDEGGAEAAESEDEVSAATFGAAVERLDWEWYDRLTQSIARCGRAVERLGGFEQRFKDAEVSPPRYRDLAAALTRVGKAAEDLRSRRPAPASAELASSEAREAGPTSDAPAGSGSAQQIAYSEPRDAREAGIAIAAAARVLRRLDPTDPTAYLLLRGFRWGELRALGEDPDPKEFAKALAAPTTEQRTRLKTLFLDEKWAELLETAEELVSRPTGRGWLDLQRYVALSADRLGPEYSLVSTSVKAAVRQLLKDAPSLLDSTLMDDVSTASRDTREWLEVHGLLDGTVAPVAPTPDGSLDTDAGRVVREASFARAASMTRAGDAQGAIELLLDRAEHESSERERFITRSEALKIMLDNGMKDFALPTLKELEALVKQHGLEEWEPTEIVAKPLTLLYRCLDDGSPMQKELHDRLSRLDPVSFMQATRGTGPSAAEPGPSSPGKGRPAPGASNEEQSADDLADELLAELEEDQLEGDDF